MSDLHSFPLLGREMPDYVPPAPEKARVFRVAENRWIWEHRCRDGRLRSSLFYCSVQPHAFNEACKHLSACR